MNTSYYTVERIDEQMYGCDELPEGQSVCCDVVLLSPSGARQTVSAPDKLLRERGIDEGCKVALAADGTLTKIQ